MNNGRDNYLRMLSKYRKKREEARINFGSDSSRYKRADIKISSIKRAIRNIDKFREQLNIINEVIKFKYGVSMHYHYRYWRDIYSNKTRSRILKIGNNEIQITEDRVKEVLILRKMFCKFALEIGVPNNQIMSYMLYDDKGCGRATRDRMDLGKLLKKDELILEKWTVFKNAVNKKINKQNNHETIKY